MQKHKLYMNMKKYSVVAGKNVSILVQFATTKQANKRLSSVDK